jgi:hypothetical protein
VLVVVIVALGAHLLTGYLFARTYAQEVLTADHRLDRREQVEVSPVSFGGPPWSLTVGFNVVDAESSAHRGDIIVMVDTKAPFVWTRGGYELGLE